jgi:hypothetical protein
MILEIQGEYTVISEYLLEMQKWNGSLNWKWRILGRTCENGRRIVQ